MPISMSESCFIRPPNDGAYVRYAVRPMTSANRTNLVQILADIQNNVNAPEYKTSSSIGYDTMMYEAFKYYGGYTSPAHANDDVAGTPVDTTHFGALRRSATNALMDNGAFSDPTADNHYIPISSTPPGSCNGKNFIILVGNGAIKSEGVSPTLLTNVGAAQTPAIKPWAPGRSMVALSLSNRCQFCNRQAECRDLYHRCL